MAGVLFRGNTGQVACTASTAKTVLQVVAASNHRIHVSFTVTFEGVSATDAPAQVRILKQTTAGTSSALTLVKDCDTDDETLQTTAIHTATVEPTASDVKETQFVHPQSGRTFGPFRVPGGQRLGVEVTVSANVDCVVAVRGEE
jgi:hypothetical protein